MKLGRGLTGDGAGALLLFMDVVTKFLSYLRLSHFHFALPLLMPGSVSLFFRLPFTNTFNQISQMCDFGFLPLILLRVLKLLRGERDMTSYAVGALFPNTLFLLESTLEPYLSVVFCFMH